MRTLVGDRSLAALEPFEAAVGEEERVELDRYRLDPWAHCDDGHVRILDLRTLRTVELRPWDHQREIGDAWIYFEETETGEVVPGWRNVHEEKSRRMGASWILAWLDLWATMYHQAPGLVLSLDFGDVDDGGSGSTPESYFGRMRFMWNELPDRYRAPLDFKLGLVKHRYNAAAYVTAEGAVADPGRGGGYRRAVIDEAARIRFGEAANAALTRACPDGRLYNSTPAGEGNVYFRIRRDRPRNFVFLRHHWSQHPVYAVGAHVAGDRPDVCDLCAGTVAGLKWTAQEPRSHRYPGKLTSPWYDDAVLELTDEEVAAELDIDYTGSLSGRIYPEFSEEVHVVAEGIGYDPAFGVELAFDYGMDFTSVILLQDAPDCLRAIGEVEVTGMVPAQVADEIRETLADLGVPIRLLDKSRTLEMVAFGDPAGEGRDLATGLPLAQHYRNAGFSIIAPRRMFVSDTILAVKRILTGIPKPFRVDGVRCPELVRHLKNNRRETDRRGNPKPGPIKPVDDEHNHMARAFAYYVAKKWPPRTPDEAIADATVERPRPRRSESDVGESSGRLDPAIGPEFTF